MKAYTDIEQSKKLAEILPIESADGFYEAQLNPITDEWEYILFTGNEWASEEVVIPCWSLVALLEIIGNIRKIFERIVTIEVGKYAGNKWYVELVFVMTESKALMTYTKELIDACYEMILKLYEFNLL